VLAQQIAHPGRINAEHQDHRGIPKALKGDVIAGTDLHVVSPGGLFNHKLWRNKPEMRRSFQLKA
jgi:hypothetical protein